MKTLLILRHAKSSWDHDDLADYDRPLSKRGESDVPQIGILLQKEHLVPDLIISSSAQRAHKTAQLVVNACGGYEHELRVCPELYLAQPLAYLLILQELGGQIDRVMVVGHNPGLEQLLEALTGQINPLPTATLAHVRLNIAHWSDFGKDRSGELVSIWRPQEMPEGN